MNQLDWARANKQHFRQLQHDHQIPALHAAAQHIHEAFNSNGSLSGLAELDCNYGGLKFAEWQRQYGCTPVTYKTDEFLDGAWIKVDAQFCHCPDFGAWLRVYAHLLSIERYQPAKRFSRDPFLYSLHICKGGYATDPAYLQGIGKWMNLLWDDYADTVGSIRYAGAITIDGGILPGPYWIENDVMHGPVDPLIHTIVEQGGGYRWEQPTRTGLVVTRSVNPGP